MFIDFSILSIVLSTLIGLLLYIWKAQMSDINQLKEEMKNKVTEDEMRQILLDKVDPMKETLEDIRNRLDHLLDKIIDNK